MSESDPAALADAYARLFSLAAHEFRTPASVVGGYLRMLQRDGDPLTDRQRRMVDEAARSCARMVEIIAELSDLSRIDGGTAAFKTESVDLFQLVREVAAGVHEAEDREVRFIVRGDASGPRISADATRLSAAFAAFFRAILREQPGKTTVVVECRRGPGGAAAVVVARDTDVQSAYDAPPAPFDDKRGGLGLALPIACRIITRYGGRVWSPAPARQSDPDAAGRSAVIIEIPVAAEPLS